MMEPIDLQTDRLKLKRLDSSFVSAEYVDWMNDEEVIRYIESGGDYSLDKLKQFLEDVDKRSILFWAILLKDDQRHIGNIKIDPINWKYGYGEYGILLGDKDEWGKGYAKEASEEVINYCFSRSRGLRKINLGVVADNKGAVNLYKKMGFEIEGRFKEHSYHDGKWCDVLRMALFNPNRCGGEF